MKEVQKETLNKYVFFILMNLKSLDPILSITVLRDTQGCHAFNLFKGEFKFYLIMKTVN